MTTSSDEGSPQGLRLEILSLQESWTPLYLDTPGTRGVCVHLLDEALKLGKDHGIQFAKRRHVLLAWLFFRSGVYRPLAVSSKELTPAMWCALEGFVSPYRNEEGEWISLREGFVSDVLAMYEVSAYESLALLGTSPSGKRI